MAERRKKDPTGLKRRLPVMAAEAMMVARATGDVVYFKFTREFIVPIMHDRKVESLVILNINLEADSSVSQKLFSMEPKIRDNIMTTLIELSNDGRTFENLTDVESYETLRAMVLLNLQKAVPTGIQNVLIVDIAQQDL
jgi:flagellar basal body-associated protein FliL